MPSVAPPKAQYTDSIVTNYWADGVNRTPSIAYSHNPAFDMDAIVRARHGSKFQQSKAAATVATLEAALARYGIAANRVHYIVPSKPGAMYCAESPELYEHFISVYQTATVFSKDTCVVRDAGNAYSRDGESIIIAAEILNDVILPPVNHHAFSVNDHSAHGVAKAKWRALKKLDNDLDSTLALLKELDNIPSAHVIGWFKRNYLYDTYDKSEEIITAAMNELLFGDSTRWAAHHEDCLVAYYDKYPQELEAIEAPPKKKAKSGKIKARGRD